MAKRILLFGSYGLFCPQANFQKCADDIAAMGYSGASVILDNRWVQPPEPEKCYFWWPYDSASGKWDMSALNTPAIQAFGKLLDVFGSKGLDLFVKFQSPYYKSSWNKFPAMKQKSHPYINNTFNISLDGDLRNLYDSIRFAPLRYTVLKWEIISEPQNKFDFLPANPLGIAWIRAHRKLIKVIGLNRTKYPAWRFGYAVSNEEEAGGPGDRSELESWFHDEFQKQGMDISPTFFRCINRQGDDAQNVQIHKDCGKKWGKAFGLESTHEFHIDGKADRDHLISLGIDPSRTLFSNDGAPEDANFVSTSKELVKCNDPFTDIKYVEAINGNTPAAPFRWMTNWNKAAKDHGAILQ